MTPKQIDKLAKDTAPKWIACAERMPDSDTAVLGFAPEDDEPVWQAYHDGEMWRDSSSMPYGVTHWMPLPAPPKSPKLRGTK